MIKTHIIALTGYAGTGKDTVADLLVTHCGFRKLAFADALRAEVAEAFGLDMVELTHRSTKDAAMGALSLRKGPPGLVGALACAGAFKVTAVVRGSFGVSDDFLDAPRSPRQIMQWWGTEYRRVQAPNYWTRLVGERIAFGIRNHERRFVITDCRFSNEAEFVRDWNGQIWQVKRPGIDGASTTEGTHASATDGSQFAPDAVINNSHDIRHLQQLVLGEFWARDAGLSSVKVEIAA